VAAGPKTWQCASHAIGGIMNRGTFVSGSGASQELTRERL
jgi:hypothetical protein